MSTKANAPTLTYRADFENGTPANRIHTRRPHLGELKAVQVQEEEVFSCEG